MRRGVPLKKVIVLENIPVSYDLQYKNVKRINLRVHRDGRVCVSAGQFVPQRQIDSFLTDDSGGMLQMGEAGDGMSAGKNRIYQDGDTMYLKGIPYRLRVIAGKKEEVEPVGRVLLLTQKDPQNESRRKRILDAFLKKACAAEIDRLCKKVYPSFQKLGISWPEIRIRSMVSRWGSCQPAAGVLTFARQLIEVPESCMEYVVVHEFSHFVHPNHSPSFHAFLDEMMPDWKERRKRLNSRDWVGRQ